MMSNETTYWYAFQKIKIATKRKNEIISFLRSNDLTIDKLFDLSILEMQNNLGLSEKEIESLLTVKQNLNNISFLAEDLQEQGFKLISINDASYPKKVFDKLKKSAPPVLFVKGNIELLNLNSVSIVGSRKANPNSISFTKNISRTAAMSNRSVVSGGASGIDSFAAQNAIENNGSTIIVLAEGVKKYKGYRQYYKAMTEGRLLVISSFDPDDRWQTFKAQERNPLIYALGDKVFIAESGDKGGTMNGALKALSEHWTVFIRFPEVNEVNANFTLIQKGCVAVDMRGKPITVDLPKSELEIEKEVLAQMEILLKGKKLTIKEILNNLNLEWKGTKLSGLIKRCENIVAVGGKPAKYTCKLQNDETIQGSLF